MPKNMKSENTYDCSKCPGYCCSYPLIEVSRGDIARHAPVRDGAATPARAWSLACGFAMLLAGGVALAVEGRKS